MPVADDFRFLLIATVAGGVIAAGQLGAVLSAYGGSPGGIAAWIVLTSLVAICLVGAMSGPAGAARRAVEGTLLGLAAWAALELVLTEWPTEGFGLDYAIGIGVGVSLALAGRTWARLAARLASIAVVSGVAALLDTEAAVSDLGFHLPVAVAAGVVLADGAFEVLWLGRPLSAALLITLPLGAVVFSAFWQERESERAFQDAMEASTPPAAQVGGERIVWRFPTRELVTGPLVAGDVVVADAADGIRGLDADTGKPLWRSRLSGRDGLAKPVLHDGLLLYPANLAGLAAFDLESGARRWQFVPPGEVGLSRVAPAGEIVVAGGWAPGGYRLFGVRTADGRLVWEKVVGGDEGDLEVEGRGIRFDSGTSSSLVDARSGRLDPVEPPQPRYTYGRTSALRSKTRGWIFRPGWEASTSEPVEVDGLVLVNVRLDPPKVNGGLYALDAATGKTRWRVELTGDADGRPVVRGRLVYVMGANTTVYAIRR